MTKGRRLLAARGITGEWLKAKGIRAEVALARGYWRHAKDSEESLERFRSEYVSLPQPWQKGYMTRLAKRADALMRPHYPASGMDAELRELHNGTPQIFTQFRPDEAIPTGAFQDHTEGHWASWVWRHHLVRNEDHGNEPKLTDAEVDLLTVEEIRAIADGGRLGWRHPHRHYRAR